MANLQTSFHNKHILEKNLPTLPLFLEEASRLAHDPKTNFTQLAEVIGHDQVISGKVLKVVNSAAYGFPRRIASIRNALVLLGFNVIKGLIVSTIVFDIVPSGMVQLWRHSVGCSIACKELGSLLKMDNTDELFLAGLLHDIGKVIVAVQLPEAKTEIDLIVSEEDLSFHEAEDRILGITHAQVGAWLAEHWNLPASLRSALAYHHRPMSEKNFPAVPAIVQVGDFLTRLFEYGSGGDENVPRLDPNIFRTLGLNQHKLGLIVDAIGEKFETGVIDLF